MGRYITIVGFDEDIAKKDAANIYMPDWFLDADKEIRKSKGTFTQPCSVLEFENEIRSKAIDNENKRSLAIMMSLFDYMGKDLDIEPYTYICKSTGYGKSFIKEVINVYVGLGYITLSDSLK